MATRRIKGLIVCDTESERSLAWGNGQNIFCLDSDKLYIINDGAYLWINQVGGASSWGGITGTLSNQTDLQTALNGKANSLGSDDNYVTDAEKVKLSNLSGTNTGDQDLSGKSNVGHTHAQSEITNLVTDLAGKLATPTGTPDGTKYLRDDNTWQPVTGGSGLAQYQVRRILRR